MEYLAQLWPFAVLGVGLIAIISLAGGSVSVRRGDSGGKLSLRSIIRAVMGHKESDRQNHNNNHHD